MVRQRSLAMWTKQHRDRKFGRLILPCLTMLFLAYFGFHAYHGEFGIYSRYQMRDRAVELQAQLDEVHSVRVELERRVRLMHDGTIEKDMLDELARKALNMSKADEVTIKRPQTAAN
jgi:cell division protein FtsB